MRCVNNLDDSRRSIEDQWTSAQGAGGGDEEADPQLLVGRPAGNEDRTASDAESASYFALTTKSCGEDEEEEEADYDRLEVRASGCRCRFCPDCCMGLGLKLRDRLLPILETFKGIQMWTFTIDPELIPSAELRAALGWAVAMGFLAKVPSIDMPKRAKGKLMRGRPIAAEEFDRMTSAAALVRPQDTDVWTRYLTGLWLSGLRLGESLNFAWDDDAPIAVDLSGRHPCFRIWAEGEKGHRDRLLPMTPDFAEFLLQTPEARRLGLVFKIVGLQSGTPISEKRVSRILSSIGQRAGVVVNKADDKFASAHDLRRAFGTRWASRVKPATLQLLMRHESIETTLNYYVAQEAADVAAELWKLHDAEHTNGFVNA